MDLVLGTKCVWGSILEIYFLCCSYCWKYFVVHDVLEKKFEKKGLISFFVAAQIFVIVLDELLESF